MLKELRESSRSLIIWVLFGIIIAVFIINFGPQATGDIGCGAAKTYVVKVDGSVVSEHGYRFGYNGSGLSGTKTQRNHYVLDHLIAREILAKEAEKAGFRVSKDLANEKIRTGEYYVLGVRRYGERDYFRNGVFDYDTLERVATSFGLPSVEYFIDQQRREILAEMMRAQLAGSSRISRAEALSRFKHAETTATVDAVRFRPAAYRQALKLTRADLDTYLASHEAEVKAKYDAEATTYKGVKPEVRLRQIYLERTAEEPADDSSPEGDDPPADDDAEPVAIDPKKTQLETLRAKLLDGTADFAATARDLSEDVYTNYKGGDMGWKRADSPGLGHAALSDALKDLEKGGITEVIDTPAGFFLLKLEDQREGDLSFEQVKYEIAETMALDYYATEGARRAADAALADALAGDGKDLEDMFERDTAPTRPQGPQLSPEMLEMLQQLSPEERQQFLQQILQGQQSGSLHYESADIPVQSQDEDPAPPADGDDSGDSAPAPADEVVPMPEDVAPPKVRQIGPFTRTPDGVPEVGADEELVDYIFDNLQTNQLADRVFEVGGDFVLIQMKNRTRPDLDKFAEDESTYIESFSNSRGQQATDEWLLERCQDLIAREKVSINRTLIQETDDQGNVLPLTYTPCSNL